MLPKYSIFLFSLFLAVVRTASLKSVLSTTAKSTVPARVKDVNDLKYEQKLPFLKSVDLDQRAEFFSIIQDDRLSKSEVWQNIENWAHNQSKDIQEEIKDFYKKVSEHVENSKLRVEKITKNLPEALQRLSEIIQNVEITRIQEKNRIANLYSSLDEDISKTLQFIIQMVSYQRNEGKELERSFKLKKLKKGGIWTGSVQATNIV